MKLIINNLQVPIETDGEDAYLHAAAQKMGTPVKGLGLYKILSKSLDLRDPDQFFYTLSLVITIDARYKNPKKFAPYSALQAPVRKQQITSQQRPIIVGFGPAGMFAALELIERGQKPLIFERGKRIDERTADVQRFIQDKTLNSESNIQFGEGGAGSYSDGKLFSRRNNNTGFINRVLSTFVKYGAPPEIIYISKPHLGTDILCTIVRNMRTHILEQGGEIFYNAKMTDITIENGSATSVIINDQQEYCSSDIYIALGHSARDTFEMLHRKGIAMEQRPISVGVRIEHPVETINQLRYGKKYMNFPGLGAATYSLNYTNKQIHKGVYTFCMCPGGEIVNASSEPNALVLNGMSYSRRSSPFSNAALVVNCHTTDYESATPLAGIHFQKSIEQRAFEAGGSNWQAPAQNLMSFLGREKTDQLPENSYKMGVTSADLRSIFPDFVSEQLVSAFDNWKDEVPLFISNQAILVAAETRTSSPVRITRTANYESTNTKNLYPIGEGSGYTGGISSSAADAIKAVEIHSKQYLL